MVNCSANSKRDLCVNSISIFNVERNAKKSKPIYARTICRNFTRDKDKSRLLLSAVHLYSGIAQAYVGSIPAE